MNSKYFIFLYYHFQCFRSASLPMAPYNNHFNRHLPSGSATDMQPTSQSFGLPSFNQQQPPVSSSGGSTILGSAASKFSSLFSVGKSSTSTAEQKNLPILNDINSYGGQYDPTMQGDQTYYSSYNYGNSTNDTDEFMAVEGTTYDGDNNNLVNNRFGKALPSVPATEKYDEYSSDYNQYEDTATNYSEPFYDAQSYFDNTDPSTTQYMGDEYNDTSLYSSTDQNSLYYSPMKSKALPTATQSQQQKTTTASSSIIGSAGAGISSLFSSLSSTLHTHPTTTTTTTAVTSSWNTSSYSTSLFNASVTSSSYPTVATTTTSSSLSFLGSSLFSSPSSSLLTSTSQQVTTTSNSYLFSSSYSTSFPYSTSSISTNSFSYGLSSVTSIDSTMYTTSSNLYSTPITSSSDYLMSSLSKGYTSSNLLTSGNDFSSIYNSSTYQTPMDTSYISQTSEVSVPSSSSFYDSSYLSTIIPKTDHSKITSSFLGSSLSTATYTSTTTTTTSSSGVSSIFSPFSSLFGTATTSSAAVTTTSSMSFISAISTTSSSLSSYSIPSTSYYSSTYSSTTTTASISTFDSSYLTTTTASSIPSVSSYLATLKSSSYNIDDYSYNPSTTLYDDLDLMTSTVTTTTTSASSYDITSTYSSLYTPFTSSLSTLTNTNVGSSYASTLPTSAGLSSYSSTLTSMYSSISDSLEINKSQSYSADMDYSVTTTSDTSSLYTPSYTSSLSSYGVTGSVNYNYGVTSYGTILGHSPIPEENENLAEEALGEEEEEESTDLQNFDLSGGEKIDNELDNLDLQIASDNVRKNSYISELYHPYNTITENYEGEEYKEDFEEGVVPAATSLVDDLYDPAPEPYLFDNNSRSNSLVVETSYGVDSYGVDSYGVDTGYGKSNILTSIPELPNDGFSTAADQEPIEFNDPSSSTKYKYTENETNYIASGDLKDTNVPNLYQNQNATVQPQQVPSFTNSSTVTTTAASSTSNIGFPSASSFISAPSLFSSKLASATSSLGNKMQQQPQQQQQQQQQPEQKKSKFGFGSFLSGGLTAMNTIKSTATNLAGGAVGVVAAAAAQATHTDNKPQQQQMNQTQPLQQQQQPITSGQNANMSSIFGNATGNLQQANSTTINNNQQMNDDQLYRQQNSNQKLTKQTTSIYEEHFESPDPYKQVVDELKVHQQKVSYIRIFMLIFNL